MIYRLIYWLFLSHFVSIAHIAYEHWLLIDYQWQLSRWAFYNSSKEDGNDRKNGGKKTEPERKSV